MPPRFPIVQPEAGSLFASRAKLLAAFNIAYNHLPRHKKRILTFYGPDGQGKTLLCRKLLDILREAPPHRHLFGHLNLEAYPDGNSMSALLALRNCLQESGSIDFVLFDAAISLYLKKSELRQAMVERAGDPAEQQAGTSASPAEESAPLSVPLKASGKASGKVVSLASFSRKKIQTQLAGSHLELLTSMKQLSPSELQEQLPHYFGLDLRAHREDPSAPPVVIILDSFEALEDSRIKPCDHERGSPVAWVQNLVAAAPGTLFVIMSREKLRWNHENRRQWAGYLNNQHPLKNITEKEAGLFLDTIPLTDAKLSKAIIKAAQNLPDPLQTLQTRQGKEIHPLFLDLALSTCSLISRHHGQPTPENIGSNHQEIVECFLKQLPGWEQTLLVLLSVPRWFNVELLEKLNEDFKIDGPTSELTSLTRHAFIEEISEGRWRVHPMMRDCLAPLLADDIRRKLNDELFLWHDAQSRPASPGELSDAHFAAFREAVFHLDTENAEAALRWFWEKWQVFFDCRGYFGIEALGQWALNFTENWLGPKSLLLSDGLKKMARLLQKTSRKTQAKPLLYRALAMDEKILGKNHPAIATDLYLLAKSVTSFDSEGGLPLLRRALAINEKNLGAHHPHVARSLYQLGSLLINVERPAEAEPLLRRALRILEQHTETGHADLIRTLNELAILLLNDNRHTEAEPLLRSAIAIEEQHFGPNSPHLAAKLNNLGLLLQETDQLAEAESIFRNLLSFSEKRFGPDHPNVAEDLNQLASLLANTNRPEEAEPLIRRALAIDEQYYGPDHHVVAGDLNHLAGLLQASDQLYEAEQLVRRALAIDEVYFGRNSPEVAGKLNNLAVLLQDTNRMEQAEILLRRALTIEKRHFGGQDTRVAGTLHNLGILLHETGDMKQAERLIRRAMAIDQAASGPDHPSVALDLNSLALLLRNTNRLSEAENLMRRALEILTAFTRTTGFQHPALGNVSENYGLILEDLGIEHVPWVGSRR